MEIKEAILETKELRLMRLGAGPKDNLRAAYDLALVFAKKPQNFKESAEAMFDRAGKFCDAYVSALDGIAGEIYHELGLTGGATGSASLSDIEYLSSTGAQRLFDVTFAQKEAGMFVRGVIDEFKKWDEALKEVGRR